METFVSCMDWIHQILDFQVTFRHQTWNLSDTLLYNFYFKGPFEVLSYLHFKIPM